MFFSCFESSSQFGNVTYIYSIFPVLGDEHPLATHFIMFTLVPVFDLIHSRSREALKRTGGENHGLWTQWSPGWTQRSRSSLRLEAEAMCCDCGGDSRMGDSLDWFKGHFKTLYRKTKYLMVKTMVSCKISLKPIHWQIQPRHENIGFNLNLKERTNDVIRMGKMMLNRLI